ncbi:chorismate mutase [Xanthomonas sp. MUS 060]|uniref:chorismate mutase n=1 Tax=Xanthomonas sp. MUS 060 TaxID=1588031 RepID=UPI00210184C5|nr:chorismate mutase [Xanthomonas sp. MUS 060]
MTATASSPLAHALTALLAGVALMGCAIPAARSSTPLEPLLDRIVARNAIGDQVALSKWDSGKPVLDSTREAAVLAKVREQAPAHGVDPDDAARFFGMQIESNKLVQYELLSRWHLRGRAPDRPRPDLNALRARLDQLQGEMLDALQASASLRQAPERQPRVVSLHGPTTAAKYPPDLCILPLYCRRFSENRDDRNRFLSPCACADGAAGRCRLDGLCDPRRSQLDPAGAAVGSHRRAQCHRRPGGAEQMG